MNSKTLTLVLIVFSLLLAALITRQAGPAWMAMPFLAYLGLGVLLAPPVERIHLRAGRAVSRLETEGTPAIEVTLTVHNQGVAIPRLTLYDPLQPGMRLVAGNNRQQMVLAAGETVQMSYTFQARRGLFAWQTLQARASDPFLLAPVRLDLPAAGELQVQPEVRRFRPIPLHPRNTLHAPGSIPARLSGSGVDFWGVREYHLGDPLRWLDWRKTANRPGKLFTKEFEQEEIADIGLILDSRQKADLQVGDDSLFDHAVQATASLAEVFLRQGNRVSLLIYGENSVSLLPGYGKVQLNRILRSLAGATPVADGSLNSLQYLPLRMFGSHSLILIVSPLRAGDWQLFPRLRSFGYQVLLVSPDPVQFLVQRQTAGDQRDQLALRLARLERKLELHKIEQLWIPVIDWPVDEPLAPRVRAALSRPGIQQER